MKKALFSVGMNENFKHILSSQNYRKDLTHIVYSKVTYRELYEFCKLLLVLIIMDNLV